MDQLLSTRLTLLTFVCIVRLTWFKRYNNYEKSLMRKLIIRAYNLLFHGNMLSSKP